MKNISLEKFRGIKAEIQYEDIMHKYSEQTSNKLKATSPKSGRAGRKTPYYLGWTVNKEDYKNGHRDTVWNETNWQLTHLLENGHFIKNRTDGLYWSPPIKHIRPAYLEVKDKYIRAMRRAPIDVDFK